MFGLKIRRQTRAAEVIGGSLIITLILINVAPILWGLLTSIKNQQDVLAYPPTILNFAPTLANYESAISQGALTALCTTVAYALSAAALAIAVGFPAAYAFDRLRFFGRAALFYAVIACIPLSLGAAALLVPTYVWAVKLGVNNTPFILPIIYASHNIPMTVWLCKGAIESVPRELDEASIVDGCSRWRFVVQILLPLCKPAVASSAFLAAVSSWNEFVASSVLVDAQFLRPLQPLIYSFIGFFGRDWGPLTAGSFFSALPMLTLFFFASRFVVGGMTKGAVKG